MSFLSRLKQWFSGKSSEVPVQVQQLSTATPQPASTTASQPTSSKPGFPPKNIPFNDDYGNCFTILKASQTVFEDEISKNVDYKYGPETRRDSYDIFQGTCSRFARVPWKDFYDFYK